MSPPLSSIFSSLEGTWQLKRTLRSSLPTFPTGTFVGQAVFTPSKAFASSSYLYHETGELRTENGMIFNAERKWIYRFSPEDAKLSVWFATADDEPDYLYHELEFQYTDGRWIAKADHLCDQDMYWAMYDFRLSEEATVERWGCRHEVKGPEKGYSTDTAYTRA